MISSTSSTISAVPAPVTAQNKAPSSDDSSSFSDVMQQQQQQQAPPSQTGKTPTTPSSTTPTTKGASVATLSNAAPDNSTPTVPATTAPATPAKAIPAPVAAGSDLSAMIIQASLLATNVPQAVVIKGVTTSTGTATDAAPTSAKDTPATTADLSTLIAQATSLLSGTALTPAVKTSGTAATTTPGKTTKDAGTTTASASDTSTSAVATPTDLSALIVQASILGTGSAATTATTVTNTPASTTGKAITGVSTKEKKSATSEDKGSFLQPGTETSSNLANALSLLGALSNAAGNSSVNQTLTNVAGPKNSALTTLAGVANSLAGTANDEKGKAMNTDLTSTAATLLSSTGANQATTSAQPDLQIKLSSNTDFSDALKQVVHVASLTQTAESRTPMRVEMEIQTPPGAIVNIYVSKSGDSLRAQLSTNDPVALAWVQNQMSSLKNTGGLGVDVKWAPPQLEAGPAITTSGSQDANLNWNQGGGQSHYEQPDERQQNKRQQTADESGLATTGSNLFMNSLTSAARAA